MTIFGNFFEKKNQVFGNFLTVKWQFSGGSDVYIGCSKKYINLQRQTGSFYTKKEKKQTLSLLEPEQSYMHILCIVEFKLNFRILIQNCVFY